MVSNPFDELAAIRQRKIEAAKTFLAVELMAGPRPASELIDKARARGHAKRTVQLASQLLNVIKTRAHDGNGRHAGAVWQLPDIQAGSTRNR